MSKILAMVALGVLASLGLVGAASAQQYPPTTDNSAVAGAGQDQAAGAAGAGTGTAGSGSGSGAPLPRTGSDLTPLLLLGVALVGAGAFWVVVSRTGRAEQS